MLFHRWRPAPRHAYEARITGMWRESRRAESTIQHYLGWIRRFLHYWANRKSVVSEGFSLRKVRTFARWYARKQSLSFDRVFHGARCAVRAWAVALRELGLEVPQWDRPRPPRSLPALVEEFAGHRGDHGGVSQATIERDSACALEFLRFVKRRRRRIVDVRAFDLDCFVQALRRRMGAKTVSGLCSALRAFLRFLHVTGRVHHDLAASLVSPRVVVMDRPRKIIEWSDVRRLIRAVHPEDVQGARDRAVILLMAAYGFGAAEVAGLDLDHVDWRRRTLQLRRPKTGCSTTLPLLPVVGRALADYVSRRRPRHATTRAIFVLHRMPHGRLTPGAIRHRVAEYGEKAGVPVPRLAGHVLRHTHASRQIDLGAPPKVVSDILGHRSPSSTSVYVRVAFRRLRAIALPVPR
jgi:integrase/recombinase XerD